MQDEKRAAYYGSLSWRRCGAGALILDPAGRVLIVEPTYKPTWEIPGGVVESGENPRQTCTRECREELGIDLTIGRLLALEHKQDPAPLGDSPMFIYDGGVLPNPAVLSLPHDELRSFRFVEPVDLGRLVTRRLAHRIHYALQARSKGTTAEIIDGSIVMVNDR